MESSHAQMVWSIWSVFPNAVLITTYRRSMCDDSQKPFVHTKPQHLFIALFVKGWIQEQHTRRSRHLHLAGWQQLCWGGASWITPRYRNVHLRIQGCNLHGPVGWGQEAREGLANLLYLLFRDYTHVWPFLSFYSPQGLLHYNRERTSWYDGEWVHNKREGWGVRWCVMA